MSSSRSRGGAYGQATSEIIHLMSLPEDIVGVITTYFDVYDLSNAGAACRELYFSTYSTAVGAFIKAFGALPETSMPRAKLFHINARASATDDTSMRDLLLWCSMRGYTAMIQRLHKRAAKLSVPAFLDSRYGAATVTPLLLAVEHGRLAVVKLLLELVSGVQHCHRALSVHCACTCANPALPPVCLPQGADPTRATAAGLQPVHLAAKHGNLAILQALHAHSNELIQSTTPDGRTALHYAAAGGHAAVVAWLLDTAQAEVDAATTLHDDVGNETALHLAAYYGHTAVVAKLLHAGASPNVQLRNGRTPALLAAELGWEEVLRLLVTRSVQYPADLSLTTDSGKGPLYCAVERGHEGMVRLLLAAGAPSNQATRRNKTALACAAEKGLMSIVKVLLDHEAAVYAASFPGRGAAKHSQAALVVASKVTSRPMKELLVAYTLPEGQRRRLLAKLGMEAGSEENGDSGDGAEEALAAALAMPDPVYTLPPRPEAAQNASSSHNPLAGIFGPSTAASFAPPASAAAAYVAAMRPGAAPDAAGEGGAAPAPAMGRTLAESMIAMRVAKEREAQEAAAKAALAEAKHRAAAVEMAANARKRKEERAAVDAEAKAKEAAEKQARMEREARMKEERERAVIEAFMHRSAGGSSRGTLPHVATAPALALKAAVLAAGLGGGTESATTSTDTGLAIGTAKRMPLSPYAEKLTAAVKRSVQAARGPTTGTSPAKGRAEVVAADENAGQSGAVGSMPAQAKASQAQPGSRASSRGSDRGSIKSGTSGGGKQAGKAAPVPAAAIKGSPAGKGIASLTRAATSPPGRLGNLARSLAATDSAGSPVVAPGGNVILPARAAPVPARQSLGLKTAEIGFGL